MGDDTTKAFLGHSHDQAAGTLDFVSKSYTRGFVCDGGSSMHNTVSRSNSKPLPP